MDAGNGSCAWTLSSLSETSTQTCEEATSAGPAWRLTETSADPVSSVVSTYSKPDDT